MEVKTDYWSSEQCLHSCWAYPQRGRSMTGCLMKGAVCYSSHLYSYVCVCLRLLQLFLLTLQILKQQWEETAHRTDLRLIPKSSCTDSELMKAEDELAADSQVCRGRADVERAGRAAAIISESARAWSPPPFNWVLCRFRIIWLRNLSALCLSHKLNQKKNNLYPE